MADLHDLVALSLLSPSWWRTAMDAIRSGASAGDVLDRLTPAAGPDQTPMRLSLDARAAAALVRGRARGQTPIAWNDPLYPTALAAIPDPPFVLWSRGVTDVLHRRAVAIVGSRSGSPYAIAVAARLASDLAARGIVIVSGLARGVDSAAHRGALEGGGSTIAILGSGADVVYPGEHKALAADIQATGVVASELAPGTPPRPYFFPLRNRIISGLSRAIVVIEAGEKSGSLITARTALEQGRDVLAVPGNVLSGRNRGAHALLRDGAKIVESADDILDELGVPPGGGVIELRSARARGGVASDPILACLAPGEPMDLDALAEQTGLGPERLLSRLLELELGGLVVRAGAGRFVRG